MPLLRLAPRLVALAAVLLIATGCGGGKVRLRLNPEDGATYEITMTTTTTSTQTIMAIETQSTQEMRMVQEMAFSRLDDGAGFEVVVTYVSASADMDITGNDTTIDLDAIMSSPMDAVLAGFEGASFTTTMSPAGKVTSVSGIDEMVARMFDAVDLPDTMQSTLQASMEQMFGDEAMQKMMGQAFMALPEGEVEVGDSWEATMSVMGMRLSSTFTLAALDGDIATITTLSTLAKDADYAPGPDVIGVVYEELDGKQVGSHRLDTKTGLMIDADLTQEMTATVRASMPGLSDVLAAAMPVIPMTATTTIRVESRKVE